ncbi:MAG: sugar transferase [Chitinophagales bacterium]
MQRIIAFIILVLISPILLLASIMVLLFSGAPVFFVQERVGKGKQVFRVYKYRTMREDKITTIGKYLRKTGIDELPQLLNILTGDMAFIGPRPLTNFDIKRLNWDTDFHKKRWSVLPGIVGLAQISPFCHAKMSWFYDCYYQEHKNFFLDIKIIGAAFLVLIVGKARAKKIIYAKRS